MSSPTPINSGESLPLAQRHLSLRRPLLTMLISILVAAGVQVAAIVILYPNIKAMAHGMVSDDNNHETFPIAARGLIDSMVSPSMLICSAISVIDVLVFCVASFMLCARLLERWSSRGNGRTALY